MRTKYSIGTTYAIRVNGALRRFKLQSIITTETSRGRDRTASGLLYIPTEEPQEYTTRADHILGTIASYPELIKEMEDEVEAERTRRAALEAEIESIAQAYRAYFIQIGVDANTVSVSGHRIFFHSLETIRAMGDILNRAIADTESEAA